MIEPVEADFQRVFVSEHRSRVLLLRGERIAFERESNGRFRRALLEAARKFKGLRGSSAAKLECSLAVDGIGIVGIQRQGLR